MNVERVGAYLWRIPQDVGAGMRVPALVVADDVLMAQGAAWAVARGHGLPADLERLESDGRIPGADAAAVSPRARERGLRQLGTLGSGNHFLEVQVVDEVHDATTARAFGVRGGQTT